MHNWLTWECQDCSHHIVQTTDELEDTTGFKTVKYNHLTDEENPIFSRSKLPIEISWNWFDFEAKFRSNIPQHKSIVLQTITTRNNKYPNC